MGLSGISVTQLLVILAIVLLVFGTKRVKTLGSDLGGAIKGFRRAMEADEAVDAGDVPPALDAVRQPRIDSSREAGTAAEGLHHTDNESRG